VAIWQNWCFVSMVVHRYGRVQCLIGTYLFWFFQLYLHGENNNKYSKYKIRHIQIHELPRTLVNHLIIQELKFYKITQHFLCLSFSAERKNWGNERKFKTQKTDLCRPSWPTANWTILGAFVMVISFHWPLGQGCFWPRAVDFPVTKIAIKTNEWK
jgi:hypothetical protein